MNDLIEKIRAEIDKDVEIVHGEDHHAQEERHWPDRIERQAAAFRKILELHVIYDVVPPDSFWKRGAHLCEVCSKYSDGEIIHDDGPACPTVLALADVYGVDHG